jgi:hypothetical protein
LLEFLVDGASFVVSRMVATTENTSDIIRAFRSVTVLCGVITCAFDASWFLMAVSLLGNGWVKMLLRRQRIHT